MGPDLDFPDWVELHNPGTADVPLARVSLVHPDGTWQGLSGSVPAGGYTVLLAGEALSFKLAADGDSLGLRVDGVEVDRVDWGETPADVALARFPDGGEWSPTIRATPGNPNGAAPSETIDPTDLLFETDQVEDLWITIDADSWSTLEADRFDEVPGSLAWRGAWFPEVGVRSKGYVGSSRGLSQKTGWKVDLNEYADHRLAGLESITLNNLVQDASYVHEALTYRLFRAVGVPAPRVGYARVYVNGTLWGLYAHIESPDDTFLARWYDDPSGNLYEGAYGVDFWCGTEYDFELDEGAEPNDRSDLTALCQALDQPVSDASLAAVEALFDLDEFLTLMAVEAVALHWDGYTTANNYRVYRDPGTGRFQMIPWGTDQTWHDAWYMPYQGGGRLFQYCMSHAGCVARYADQLERVAGVAESLGLEARMDELTAVLTPYIEQDPRREFGLDAWQASLETTRYYLRNQPATARSYAAWY